MRECNSIMLCKLFLSVSGTKKHTLSKRTNKNQVMHEKGLENCDLSLSIPSYTTLNRYQQYPLQNTYNIDI